MIFAIELQKATRDLMGVSCMKPPSFALKRTTIHLARSHTLCVYDGNAARWVRVSNGVTPCEW